MRARYGQRLKNDATAGYISRSVRSQDILIVEQKLITVTPTAAARGAAGHRAAGHSREADERIARERTRREISRVVPSAPHFTIFPSPRPHDSGVRKWSTCAREHLTVPAISANPR